MTEDERRALGAFLRSHRDRLTTAKLGLSAGERRRAPGLRREELAALSGLSTTWLSWIEQGRDISVSPLALSRLGTALRLNRAERAYMFELARKQDPHPDRARTSAPPDALKQVIAAIDAPAYGLDRLWCACEWNATAAHLFAPWLQGPGASLLDFVFGHPAAPALIADWSDRARRLVAEFRADTSHFGDDPEVASLVGRLRRDYPAFDGFWQAQDVLAREGGLRTFDHPQDGPLRYEQVTLQLAGYDGFKIVVLFPAA